MLAALRKRYPVEAYALFSHVPNATGGGARSIADALIMGLWPSRGLEITGCEIKVSRSDWLREYKAPGKAETIAKWCDRWWLVVSDREIVKEGELPPLWGLLVAHGDQLRVVVEAPKLTPVPWPKGFLASILRSAQSSAAQIGEAEIHSEVERRWKAHRDRDEERNQQDVKRLREELSALQRVVNEFEAASGIRLNSWDSGREVGDLVRTLSKHGVTVQRGKLENLRAMLGRMTATTDEAIKAMAPADETPEQAATQRLIGGVS